MVVCVLSRKDDYRRIFNDVQTVSFTGGSKFWIDTFDSTYGYPLSEFSFSVVEE